MAVRRVADERELGAAVAAVALEEQLGLELEPRTAPFDVLVIDSVEMPAEN